MEMEGELSSGNLPSASGLSNNMQLTGIQQPQQQEAEPTAYLSLVTIQKISPGKFQE